MKSYWGKNEVRMVGKAWEVRQRLRVLANRENTPGTTVADVLKRRSKVSSRRGRLKRSVSQFRSHRLSADKNRAIIEFSLAESR